MIKREFFCSNLEKYAINKTYWRLAVLTFLVVFFNLVVYLRLNGQKNVIKEEKIFIKVPCNENINQQENILDNILQLSTQIVKNDDIKVKPSVFCLIKTHPDNISKNKTLTVLNIWGRKCDNYR